MECVIAFRDIAEDQSSPAALKNANIDAMRKVQWRSSKAETTKLGKYQAVGTGKMGIASLKRLNILSQMFRNNHLFF